ncbi:hypothetical protein BV898_18875 [Hypsibius exemplaris]|uniref:Uncharacterized protein n=1 Tax=Hypsibius exemplaris TaxID=2072580 RepID=A0A9X6NKP7_HYPEX|nr:hypothetical protein BV898_18875 [Hypsibius exemplaris]
MILLVACWQRFSRFFTFSRVVISSALLLFFLGIRVNENVRQRSAGVPYTCSKLFKSGSLDRNISHERNGTWKPNGCNIRYRTINESVGCMSDLTNKNLNAPFIVFAGDSRPRQLRDGLVLALTGQDWDKIANPKVQMDDAVYKKHESNGEFHKSAGVHVRFEWIFHLDNGTGNMTHFIQHTILSEFKPNLLVLGVGVHRIRECHRKNISQANCAQEYKQHFLKLLPLLLQLSNTTDIIWVPQTVINERLLRPPGDIGSGFTNENALLYNRMITEALDTLPDTSRRKITYWHSAWQSSVELNDGLDGLHLGPHTKHHLTQMLIDWLCSSVSRREVSTFRRYQRLVWGSDPPQFCCS